MGIDIEFKAVLPMALPAAARFLDLCRIAQRFPNLVGPLRLSVYEGTNSATAVATAQSDTSNAQLSEDMHRLAADHAGTSYSFRSTWVLQGNRGAQRTTYTLHVTIPALSIRYVHAINRNVDLTWNIGDSRRYTPEGKEQYPSVEQVISDLQVLIELGASSIWASGPGEAINPLELYAVYHRDTSDYRGDGLDDPLPSWPIEDVHLELADEYSRQDEGIQQLLPTGAGPIVYSPLLVRGTLNMFYMHLARVLRADVQDQIERTGGASYRAYEYDDNHHKWISVERRSDGAEILRLEPPQSDAQVLTIAYEITELGFDDRLARILIRLLVLNNLYEGRFRSTAREVHFKNLTTKTIDILPSDSC